MRTIRPARSPLRASLEATPSKSVTHRALVAAALARSPSVLRDPLDAEDTRITRTGLVQLGARVEDAPRAWIVEGPTHLLGGGRIDLGESGTSMRLLAAVCGLGRTPTLLDGAARLRERPMREMLQALTAIGVEVDPVSSDGLPLSVGGSRPRGGAVRLWAERSSQFASALLLIGSRLEHGIAVTLEGRPVSLPYVELTADVLRAFGVSVERTDTKTWVVAPADYPGRDYAVEGDFSSASYFLASAAIVGGRVRVGNLRAASRQADAVLLEILERLGSRVEQGVDHVEIQGNGHISPFEVDLTDAPDLGPTIAALGLFAEGPCTVSGVAHLRHKESDRLELLARNLTALGRASSTAGDRLEIGPPGPLRGTTVCTGSDHRLAMAFAVAGLRVEGLSVDDAGCVSKSNPRFWEQFAALEG